MKLEIEMECNNSAFDEDPTFEIRRILEEMLDKLDGGMKEGYLLDINGNLVGEYKLKD